MGEYKPDVAPLAKTNLEMPFGNEIVNSQPTKWRDLRRRIQAGASPEEIRRSIDGDPPIPPSAGITEAQLGSDLRHIADTLAAPDNPFTRAVAHQMAELSGDFHHRGRIRHTWTEDGANHRRVLTSVVTDSRGRNHHCNTDIDVAAMHEGSNHGMGHHCLRRHDRYLRDRLAQVEGQYRAEDQRPMGNTTPSEIARQLGARARQLRQEMETSLVGEMRDDHERWLNLPNSVPEAEARQRQARQDIARTQERLERQLNDNDAGLQHIENLLNVRPGGVARVSGFAEAAAQLRPDYDQIAENASDRMQDPRWNPESNDE